MCECGRHVTTLSTTVYTAHSVHIGLWTLARVLDSILQAAYYADMRPAHVLTQVLHQALVACQSGEQTLVSSYWLTLLF